MDTFLQTAMVVMEVVPAPPVAVQPGAAQPGVALAQMALLGVVLAIAVPAALVLVLRALKSTGEKRSQVETRHD